MDDDALRHLLNELRDHQVESSGLVLFRVTGTWAHKGRTGDIDYVVLANNAIEAIRRAWDLEDNSDLRTIHAEWMCPVESVLKWSDMADD